MTIDYHAQCLHFSPAVLETDTMRSQLTALARRLHGVVGLIGATSGGAAPAAAAAVAAVSGDGAALQKEAASRRAFFSKVRASISLHLIAT